MTRLLPMILLAAGTATPAFAQNTEILFEASNDAGASWARSVDAMPGQDVIVRVRVRVVNNTDTAVFGLSSITFQPRLTGWMPATDTRLPFTTSDGSGVPLEPQTNTGRIAPFASSGMNTGSVAGLLSSHVDGGSTLRFAGTNATTPTTNLAWGVSSGQTPVSIGGTNFRTGTDVVVFRYAVRLNGSEPRDLIATVDLATIVSASAAWYRIPGDEPLRPRVTQDTILPATIHLIPAPGTISPALALLLLTTRRRTP